MYTQILKLICLNLEKRKILIMDTVLIPIVNNFKYINVKDMVCWREALK